MAGLELPDDSRLLTGRTHNEDSAILSFPAGKALVQTVDFFTPIVNDPVRFGRIAAANALSDVYAMGGEPYCAMNIVCFPIKTMDKSVLGGILKGGLEKITESGAVLAGGHSVEDEEIKYGLSVTGAVSPDGFASNSGLCPGDVLLLTKPIGTGVLATALKADLPDADKYEDRLYHVASRLNKGGGRVISELGLRGATDVTGFGLGGHVLEMAHASQVSVDITVREVPIIEGVMDLAAMGMIPAGSFANKQFCSSVVQVAEGIDPILCDLMFDAQTSGGLVLSVPVEQLDRAMNILEQEGDLATCIGMVHERGARPALLNLV